MKMTRGVVGLVAVGASAVLMAGCAPSSDTDTAGSGSTAVAGASSDPATITVWSWRVEDKDAYEKIFDVYEKAHPGVTVDFKPFKSTEYNTILATGLAGADGPDVAQVRSYGQLQPTVASGSLVDLDGKVDLSKFDANVVQSVQGKDDGRIYAVPLAVQTLQMYYNQELFTKAGISAPPTTWAEFTADLDKLKAADVTPLAVGAKDDWTLPILHQVLATPRFGGTAFQKAVLSGAKTFGDPDWVASVDDVKKLEQYMPESPTAVAYTDAQAMFTGGTAAMFPGGSFELGYFQKQNPDLKMGVFEVPAPDGSPSDGAVTPGYADGAFGVNTKSSKQDASLALVKWMATPEFGQMVADEIKQLSAVPGVTYTDPLLKQMADNYQAAPTPYLLLADFRYGTPSGGEVFGKGMQSLLLGEKDAATVSADLQTGISAWFKPTK